MWRYSAPFIQHPLAAVQVEDRWHLSRRRRHPSLLLLLRLRGVVVEPPRPRGNRNGARRRSQLRWKLARATKRTPGVSFIHSEMNTACLIDCMPHLGVFSLGIPRCADATPDSEELANPRTRPSSMQRCRYLAIARRGKEAANERHSCPATHVHHKVVVANKELTCFILCHRDVLCLYSLFFGTTDVWVSNWAGGFTYIWM
jgi:hypothetical protein